MGPKLALVHVMTCISLISTTLSHPVMETDSIEDGRFDLRSSSPSAAPSLDSSVITEYLRHVTFNNDGSENKGRDEGFFPMKQDREHVPIFTWSGPKMERPRLAPRISKHPYNPKTFLKGETGYTPEDEKRRGTLKNDHGDNNTRGEGSIHSRSSALTIDDSEAESHFRGIYNYSSFDEAKLKTPNETRTERVLLINYSEGESHYAGMNATDQEAFGHYNLSAEQIEELIRMNATDPERVVNL